MEHGYWKNNPDKLAYLIKYYPHWGAEVLAEELDLPLVVLRNKANRLKLHLLPRSERICFRCRTRVIGPTQRFGRYCAECFSENRALYRRSIIHKNPLEERFVELARTLRLRNKKMGEDSAVSVDELLSLWKKQEGLCAYSGREMVVSLAYSRGRNMDSISIDRIDSGLPYINDNIALCTWWANLAKTDITPDDFIHRCREVVMFADAHHPAKTIEPSSSTIRHDEAYIAPLCDKRSLEKRALACNGFRWLPGMVGRVEDWWGRVNEVKDGRVIWHTENSIPGHTRPWPKEAIPDFDDPLTELAMLPMVRAAWRNDKLVVRHFPKNGKEREEWAVCRRTDNSKAREIRIGVGLLEVEALVKALEGAPSFGRVNLGEPEAFREERD